MLTFLPGMLSVRLMYPGSILYKSIAGRYRPVRIADGPITVCFRFIKNATWVGSCFVAVVYKMLTVTWFCIFAAKIWAAPLENCFSAYMKSKDSDQSATSHNLTSVDSKVSKILLADSEVSDQPAPMSRLSHTQSIKSYPHISRRNSFKWRGSVFLTAKTWNIPFIILIRNSIINKNKYQLLD